MIDRVARNQVGELLRHLATGRLTNDEFEDRLPVGSKDAGVRQLISAAWMLYSDLYEHRLVDRHALSSEDRSTIARWILFLQANEEYRWPRHPLEGFPRMFATVLTLGWLPRIADTHWKRAGEFSVWPFLTREEYQAALEHPRFLAATQA